MNIQKAKRHKAQSLHYFENALHHIKTGDAEKASELLWGSIAQAIKAVAASRGIYLKSHDALRRYVVDLARVLADDSLRYSFEFAQSLHGNFYECGLDLEYIIMASRDVKKALNKLLSLIPVEKVS